MNYLEETLTFYYFIHYCKKLFPSYIICFSQKKDNVLLIHYRFKTIQAILSFWENGLIEMEIHHEDYLFYLHFKYNTMSHFLKMLMYFKNSFLNETKKQKYLIGIYSNDMIQTLRFLSKIKEIQKYEYAPYSFIILSNQSKIHVNYIFYIPQMKKTYLKHLSKKTFLIDTTLYATLDAHQFLRQLDTLIVMHKEK